MSEDLTGFENLNYVRSIILNELLKYNPTIEDFSRQLIDIRNVINILNKNNLSTGEAVERFNLLSKQIKETVKKDIAKTQEMKDIIKAIENDYYKAEGEKLVKRIEEFGFHFGMPLGVKPVVKEYNPNTAPNEIIIATTDKEEPTVSPILKEVYGEDAPVEDIREELRANYISRELTTIRMTLASAMKSCNNTLDNSQLTKANKEYTKRHLKRYLKINDSVDKLEKQLYTK